MAFSSMSHKIIMCSYAQLVAFLVTDLAKNIHFSKGFTPFFFLPHSKKHFAEVHNLLVKPYLQIINEHRYLY